MKGRQHTAIVLLLVLTSILAHNLVPHHHHAGFLCPVNDRAIHHHRCPGNAPEKEDHKALHHDSRHCHAFNALDLQRYKKAIALPKALQMDALLLSLPFEALSRPEPGLSWLILPQKIPELSGPPIGGSGLRAPPEYCS